MVQLNWTHQARKDLKTLADYIAGDSILYAKRQVLKIKQETQVLKQYPLIGRKVPEFNHEQIREIVSNPYRIIYLIVNEQHIDILAIHHTSRKDINLDV